MRFFRGQKCFFIGVFALVCSSAPGLTQQEMTDAVLDAIFQWGEITTGESGVPMFYGLSDFDMNDFAYYLTYAGHTSAENTREVYNLLRGDNPRFWNFLRGLSSASSNELVAVRSVLSSLSTNVVSWSNDARSHYGAVLEGFASMDRGLSLLGDSVGSIEGICSSLQSISTASTSLVTHIDSDLHDILDDLYDLQYMLSGSLIAIQDALYDARGSSGSFYGWVTNSLIDGLDGLRVTLDEPIHVIADNLDWFSDWESTNTLLLTSIGRDSRNLNTNFLAFSRDWRNVYLPFATNYFSSAMLTDSQSLELALSTNAFATNLVSDALAVSNLQDQASRDEAEYTNRLAEVFDQPFTENPYDGGDSVISNLGSSAMDLVGNVDPATSSDVIILGSVDPLPSRSMSSASWSYWVQKLPRIGFDMEQIFVRSRRLLTVKNLFAAVWLIVGVFYKLILLSRFADWFSRVSKR